LALRDDGAIVGSVSGGCIEDDLIAKNGDGEFRGSPRLLRYGIDADEAHRFGLPCGGTLELMLEFDPDAGSLNTLIAALESGKLMRRRVALGDGSVTLGESAEPEALQLDGQALASTFGPEFRMLLIGAGALSEYLATMAQFSGFAVTVCDPRTEYSGHWSVSGVTVATGMPDDVVQAFRPDRRSCVIALTHDPKLDDLALLEALESDAFYVGAIGSRRNNAARRERLAQHFDVSAESLARLRGPIGLYIGSKTPPEIAVSVMAEVLAVKNGVALPAAMDVASAKQAEGALAA
jgi:xanthine dehydrogenase accessory factor